MSQYLAIGQLFNPFVAAGIAVAVTVIIIYFFSSSTTEEKWRKSNLPFARPIPLFGDTFKSSLGLETAFLTFHRIYQRFSTAPICGLHQMRTPYLMIRDPTLINAILIKDFEYFTNHGFDLSPTNPLAGSLFFANDRKWKIMRQKLSPGFTSGKLKLMHGQVVECSRQLIHYVNEKLGTTAAGDEQSERAKLHNTGDRANPNQPLTAIDGFEVSDIISKYSTDVIGTCAFGLNLDSIKDDDSEFRKYSRIIFKVSFRMLFVQMLRMLSPWLSKRLTIIENPPAALNFFKSAFREVIDYRERNAVNRNDVAQTLMQARKELVLKNHELYAEENFTEMDIIGNAILMFLAGADPVTDTLSFCLYELAINKQVQDKLRQHIYTTKEKYNGEFSNDYLMDLHYADMVILETLRKCNGVPFLFRIATQNYQVPNHSLVIEKGQKIIIPNYSIHHDPKYYPNPEIFDPERFTPNEKAKRPSGTDLFFGDGPRFCIGKRLAELEMKLCLSDIISKFEVVPCGKTEYPIKLSNGQSIKAKNGIWLSLKPI